LVNVVSEAIEYWVIPQPANQLARFRIFQLLIEPAIFRASLHFTEELKLVIAKNVDPERFEDSRVSFFSRENLVKKEYDFICGFQIINDF